MTIKFRNPFGKEVDKGARKFGNIFVRLAGHQHRVKRREHERDEIQKASDNEQLSRITAEKNIQNMRLERERAKINAGTARALRRRFRGGGGFLGSAKEKSEVLG